MQAHLHVTTDDPSVRAHQDHPDEARADFEAIYRKFRPRLKRFLRSRINDPDLTDDLVHETLVRAIAAGDRFDPSRPVWPWLRTIAANVATDSLRRSASAREELCGHISDSGRPDPDSAEERAVLEQALRGLPGRDRAALSLCYLDDWKHTEVAAFLGLTRPGFDKLLSRARRRLRLEYSRIDSSLRGLLVLPTVRIKAWMPRWRRAQGVGGLLPPSVVESTSHLMAAFALLIATGSAITPPSPRPASDQPSASAMSDPHSARLPAEARGAGEAVTPAKGEGPSPTQDEGTLSPSAAAPGGNDPVEDITDPNGGVRDPEDVQVTSLAFGSEDGSSIYAAGATHCRVPACPPVLFHSADGGRSWKRLPARGLNGADIAVPPGHDRHHKIFAMGTSGLQISTDRGKSFEPVVAAGAPITTGSMAVSPTFHQGDPTVLVGAQTLLQYRDSTGAFDPFVGSMNGPFEPTFSPTYAEDRLFFLGALRTDGIQGMKARVSICNPTGCLHKTLPSRGQIPKVRVSDGSKVVAFTENDLFVAEQSTYAFSRLDTPWRGSLLLDLAAGGDGKVLVAAVSSSDASPNDGVYISRDAGGSWTRAKGALLRSGALRAIAGGDRIVVALRDGGLACSRDGGRTFARRCKS